MVLRNTSFVFVIIWMADGYTYINNNNDYPIPFLLEPRNTDISLVSIAPNKNLNPQVGTLVTLFISVFFFMYYRHRPYNYKRNNCILSCWILGSREVEATIHRNKIFFFKYPLPFLNNLVAYILE